MTPDFVAETFSRRSSFGDAFSRQNANVDAMYRPAPQVTLTLTDNLISSLDTITLSRTQLEQQHWTLNLP